MRIGDFLALDREMVEPKPGDLLAVMTAGAYGAVQAGTYNTRALVPEVLVNGWRMGAGAAAPGGRAIDRAGSPAGLVITVITRFNAYSFWYYLAAMMWSP